MKIAGSNPAGVTGERQIMIGIKLDYRYSNYDMIAAKGLHERLSSLPYVIPVDKNPDHIFAIPRMYWFVEQKAFEKAMEILDECWINSSVYITDEVRFGEFVQKYLPIDVFFVKWEPWLYRESAPD